MTVDYRDETPFTGDNHTPTELANAIRTKKYGKDVREPIAQLAGKLDSAIKGQNIGSVVATPTKVFANLSALQSAYPNGADGVMATIDNGHKYFWQDGSWVDGGVYQAAANLNSISYEKVINSEIDYDRSRSWGSAQFTIGDNNVISFSSSSIDKGVILPLKKSSNYVNVRIASSTQFEQIENISLYDFDASASNGVGDIIVLLELSPDDIQSFLLPETCNEIMVASHGSGSVTIEIVAGDDAGIINLKSDIRNLTQNSTNIEKIVDPEVEGISFDIRNIGTFGNATKSMQGNFVTANVGGNNGGFLTGNFTSHSERTKINIDGHFTQSGVTVQIQYLDQTDSSRKYIKLANISGGKLTELNFDASSAIIYQNADPDQFKILIQSNIDSVPENNPIGQIFLKSISVYEPTDESFEGSLMYHYKLKNTLASIIENLSNLSAKVNSIPTNQKSYATMADGSKREIIYVNGELTIKSSAYKKVLFLGNSLLLGLSTNGANGAPFGLTASNPQKDWAYLLTEKLRTKGGGETISKLHDAPFEQSELNSTSATYISNNLSNAEKNNDLVIVQIGDNVNTSTRRAIFRANFDNLIKAIREDNPTADILIAGVWFDGDNLQSWLKEYASSHNCLFTPLHDLYTSANLPKLGDTITFENGVQMQVYDAIKTHPGDLGMQAIADRIFNTLYPS